MAFYDTFWSNLVRWLSMGGEFSPDQHVALHLSRTTVRLGDPLAVDVVYKHTPAVGRPSETRGDKPRKAAAGSRAGADPVAGTPVSRDAQTGASRHLRRSASKAPGMQPLRQVQRFNVYDTNVERLMTMADPMALRMLAEHSGGRFYEADQAGDLVNQLRLFRLSQQVPPQLEYIWDHGALMVVLLVWGGSEWLLRRFSGLL